jgi:hypothetical protein
MCIYVFDLPFKRYRCKIATDAQIYESFAVVSVLPGFFYAPMGLLLVVLPGESGHWQELGTGCRGI